MCDLLSTFSDIVFSFSKFKLVLILPSSKKLIDPFCSETVIDKQSVCSVILKLIYVSFPLMRVN